MHDYHEYCKILCKELCTEFDKFECDHDERTLHGIKMILGCMTDLQELEAGGAIRRYMSGIDFSPEHEYRGIYNYADKEGWERTEGRDRNPDAERDEDWRKRRDEREHGKDRDRDMRYEYMHGIYNMAGAMKHKDKLTEQEKMAWVDGLQNADGTVGPTFSKEQAASIAKKVGAKYDHYDETDFYLVLNMVYSDLCEALAKAGANADSPTTYGYIALSWLDDADSYPPEEHLARYHEYIVKH